MLLQHEDERSQGAVYLVAQTSSDYADEQAVRFGGRLPPYHQSTPSLI
jgi:hypothetical protein